MDSLDSPLNHHISREEAQNLIPDLFPAANALDELGERDDNELEWRDVVQITTEWRDASAADGSALLTLLLLLSQPPLLLLPPSREATAVGEPSRAEPILKPCLPVGGSILPPQ